MGSMRKALRPIVLLALILLSPLTAVGAKSAPTITTVKVGPNPSEIVYNPSNKEVYVTLDPHRIVTGPGGILEEQPGGVVVISGTTVVANLTVGAEPSGLIYDSANGDMYVAVPSQPGNPYSPMIVRVISGNSVVANITGLSGFPLIFDPSDNYLYLLDRVGPNGTLSAISGTTIVEKLNVGFTSATATYDPSNGYAYIPYDSGIAVVSGTGIVGNIRTASAVTDVLADPSSGNVYFEVYGSDAISVLSGANLIANFTLKPPGLIPGPLGPLTYDTVNNYVYVAMPEANMVSVISGTKVVGNVTVGSRPEWTGYNPANGYVYVSNQASKTVSVISGETVVATIAAPSDAGYYYNPSDSNVYLFERVNATSGTFTIVSGTNIVGNLTLAVPSAIFAYDQSNNDTYMANLYSDTVSVLSTSGQTTGTPRFNGLAFAVILVAVVLSTLVVGGLRRRRARVQTPPDVLKAALLRDAT
jgi:DNA-binding beta-propeller fold protein YncE